MSALLALLAGAASVCLAFGESPVDTRPAHPSTVRVAQAPSDPPPGHGPAISGPQEVLDLLLQPSNAIGEQDVEADVFSAEPGAASEPSANAPDTHGARTFHVPLANSPDSRVAVRQQHGKISLVVRDATLNEVLTRLAETHGFNIVTAEQLTTKLTITLDGVPLDDAMDAVLSVAGYTWIRKNNIVFVTSVSSETKVPAEMQDRRVEVFHLDYASAADLQPVVTGMLSPVGNAYVLSASEDDNRKTRDSIVVEDLPSYLNDIRQFIMQMDIPPRQVLIEAHVLSVDLGDDHKHGVNFEHLFDLSSNGVTLETKGFANDSSPRAFFVNLSGGHLTALLECLKTTTDAKTLASPRIVVVNGQTARIQVGEQLGFRVTTTTETVTSESVEFLDVGVVLKVTPRISQTDVVTMRVSPEVSQGEINPNTGLPEESTTELETDVALASGQGLVIGGLIQELDTDLQSKIPLFGDLHIVGKLFQRREANKMRREIVIALIPRVIPYDPLYQERATAAYMSATSPLLCGPLEPCLRPWEPCLPDANDNPYLWRLPPLHEGCLWPQYGSKCGCAGNAKNGTPPPGDWQSPKHVAPVPPAPRVDIESAGSVNNSSPRRGIAPGGEAAARMVHRLPATEGPTEMIAVPVSHTMLR
jgi:type II secretory pathway component GspD/PulD (secretin)